jgi:hypothetical protein
LFAIESAYLGEPTMAAGKADDEYVAIAGEVDIQCPQPITVGFAVDRAEIELGEDRESRTVARRLRFGGERQQAISRAKPAFCMITFSRGTGYSRTQRSAPIC